MDTTSTIVDINIASAKPVAKETIHRMNLREFLTRNAGQLVGLDFVKADGSDRKITARLGVRKHLRGGVNTVEGQDRPYITMFDMSVLGYRAVNLATVSCVRSNGRAMAVIG